MQAPPSPGLWPSLVKSYCLFDSQALTALTLYKTLLPKESFQRLRRSFLTMPIALHSRFLKAEVKFGCASPVLSPLPHDYRKSIQAHRFVGLDCWTSNNPGRQEKTPYKSCHGGHRYVCDGPHV